jgi:hypothetical protein
MFGLILLNSSEVHCSQFILSQRLCAIANAILPVLKLLELDTKKLPAANCMSPFWELGKFSTLVNGTIMFSLP